MNFVIDASVAGAAGTSEHPCATRCRRFLDCFRSETNHQIVLTPETIQEWKRHQTKFARTFLKSMFSKNCWVDLKDCANPHLRRRIARTRWTDTQRLAVEKDTHLVESAMKSNASIASLDEIARGLFRIVGRAYKPCAELVWANPDTEHDAVLRWIRGEAPAAPNWRLGAAIE